jgi:DNA sulfur modification protein DndD
MILEPRTVRNFCLFVGEQTFDLRPGRRNGRHLPIVLFGGINGAGKTTLLDIPSDSNVEMTWAVAESTA